MSDQHCCNPDGTTRPLILVTASVDKMVVKKPIQVDTDLKIAGAVTWVGRSSLEIQLEVTQSKRGIAELNIINIIIVFFSFLFFYNLSIGIGFAVSGAISFFFFF